MKYLAATYGKALAAVIVSAKGKNDAAIEKNFLALVRKNGDEANFKKILDQAEFFLRKSTGMRGITVVSARPLQKGVGKLLKEIMKPGDTVMGKIDPELIAGVKIIVNDEMQFDGSLKGKLDTLFNHGI